MTGTRRVISHITCLNPKCKATVEARVNKNEKVYYFCDGHMDDKQCGGAWKYGATDSRKMIAEAAKLKTKQESEIDNGEETSTEEDDIEEDNTGEGGQDTGHDGESDTGDETGSDTGSDTGDKTGSGEREPTGTGIFG